MERKREMVTLDLIKIATVVAVFVTALFFGAAPNLFTASVLGITAYIGYEVITVTQNMKEILEDGRVELMASFSQKAMRNQLTKGAPLFRTFVVLSQP